MRRARPISTASALAFALLAAASSAARADERVDAVAEAPPDAPPELRAGAAVGAGGQGDATYGAIDLRLDLAWRGARLGLGARAVWLDGELRRREWQRPIDALRIVRLVEVSHRTGEVQLALAAGGLAPPQLAHVADGYRAALDDRPRTGARGSLVSERLAIGVEIDDAIDPGLIGGAVAWQVAPPWGATLAAAIDPSDPAAAIEAAGARRWDATHARLELGAGIVVEPQLGAAALAFADAAVERAGARWTARGELRAGTGTVGAAFGPLHRLERAELFAHARSGLGAALSAGVAGSRGWLRAGIRHRPELGVLGTVEAGAPMGRTVQAGGWLAASKRHAAGAAELRVAWARRLASALELARMYDVDAMQPAPAWSITAWFAVSTE